MRCSQPYRELCIKTNSGVSARERETITKNCQGTRLAFSRKTCGQPPLGFVTRFRGLMKQRFETWSFSWLVFSGAMCGGGAHCQRLGKPRGVAMAPARCGKRISSAGAGRRVQKRGKMDGWGEQYGETSTREFLSVRCTAHTGEMWPAWERVHTEGR